MSNYVHNYLFCDDKAKEKILSLNYGESNELHGPFDISTTSIWDNKFLVVFDTIGMEYSEEFIVKFIKEFHSTKWYCIEENEVEQGCYFWNGLNVVFSRRNLVETLNENEIRIKYSDYEYRPFRSIFISGNIIVFENFLKNEMKKYVFSENAKIYIQQYIKSLLNVENEDYINFAIPIKDGIDRDICIDWEGKCFRIESFGEWDDWHLDVKDGEQVFHNLISFFDSILVDEKINETVSFELLDELKYM